MRAAATFRYARIFRISLRGLLALITLFAVVTASISGPALRQRWAVAELTKFGADVAYSERSGLHPIHFCPGPIRRWLGRDFTAVVTKVRFGMDSSWERPSPQAVQSGRLIVLSDRSRSLRQMMLAPGRRQNPDVGLKSPVIPAEVLGLLRDLPQVSTLSIRGVSTSAASPKTFARFSYDTFLLDIATLRSLNGCSHLTELNLSGIPADDQLLQGISGIRKLQYLTVGAACFTAKGARDLGALDELQELTFVNYLSPSQFFGPDASIERFEFPGAFPSLPKLRILRAPYHQVSNEAARALRGCQALQQLECEWIRVDDEGVRHLSALSELRELNLVESRITDAGAVYLGRMTELRVLILTNSRLTDAGLQHLRGLTKLEQLYLPHMPITDAGLAHLRGAKGMRQLSLTGTNISSQGIRHLTELPQLEELDLAFTKIDDTAIDHLLRLKKLSLLRLSGTDITPEGADRLRAGFPTTRLRLP